MLLPRIKLYLYQTNLLFKLESSHRPKWIASNSITNNWLEPWEEAKMKISQKQWPTYHRALPMQCQPKALFSLQNHSMIRLFFFTRQWNRSFSFFTLGNESICVTIILICVVELSEGSYQLSHCAFPIPFKFYTNFELLSRLWYSLNPLFCTICPVLRSQRISCSLSPVQKKSYRNKNWIIAIVHEKFIWLVLVCKSDQIKHRSLPKCPNLADELSVWMNFWWLNFGYPSR